MIGDLISMLLDFGFLTTTAAYYYKDCNEDWSTKPCRETNDKTHIIRFFRSLSCPIGCLVTIIGVVSRLVTISIISSSIATSSPISGCITSSRPIRGIGVIDWHWHIEFHSELVVDGVARA